MKTLNGQCTKRCRWLKVTKTQKNVEKANKKQRVLAGPPLPKSLEIFPFFCFSKVFTKCWVLQGNWHESQAKLSKCLWECSKTSQNIILYKSWGNCAPRGCRSVFVLLALSYRFVELFFLLFCPEQLIEEKIVGNKTTKTLAELQKFAIL